MRAVLLRRHVWPVLALLALPTLANALVLSGWLRNNPALFTMFLTSGIHGVPLPSAPGWFDPTIGLITQPLGMLSAQDWLHGIVPWWNPYSGPGMPLAAEMQTLSFFLPFVLLLKFWPGWLALKLLMQMLCGLFTYALMIELGTTRLAAGIAGGLFALSATFFLIPHVMGTLPWAPLLLLGIERTRRAVAEGRAGGWGLIPLALAYLIYGGYPEVAYIEGVLASAWTLWRFAAFGAGRWRFIGRIALGGSIGLALALPLLVPFFVYVSHSFLGAHAKAYSWLWLLPQGAPVQLLPFVYGPIGAGAPPGLSPRLANLIAAYWVQLGGWFGPVATVLAIAAALRGRRGLIVLLWGFIVVWQARIWGFPPAIWLIDLIPMMGKTDAMRFCGPAMELAMFILAGIAVDGWQRAGALDRRLAVRAGQILLGLVAIGILAASPALLAWFRAAPGRLPFAVGVSLVELGLAIAALALLTRQPSRRTGLALGLVLMADPLLGATLTTLGAPRTARVVFGGVAYLQRHLGLHRIYSLQPFGPNYPAAFHLASIDDNASPVAEAWNRYIHRHLDPYADVVMFTGSQARELGCVLLPPARAALFAGVFIRPTRQIIPPDQSAELRRNLKNYEAIGVKYVLAPPSANPFVRFATLPVDAARRVPLALGLGAALSGTIPGGTIGQERIDTARVMIGTYRGAAGGFLSLKLCAGDRCASGQTALAGAADNAPLAVSLAPALAIAPGTPLRYTITHEGGPPVAIWLGALDTLAPASLAAGMPGHAPLIDFGTAQRQATATQAYRDAVVSIWRLPDPAPYFRATPSCRLDVDGRKHLTTDCPAPARLTRLEAWDAGWHARVNGRPAPLGRVDDLFQSVALPAGHADVSFYYRPPYTHLSCASAIAALLAWIGLVLSAAAGNRRRFGA